MQLPKATRCHRQQVKGGYPIHDKAARREFKELLTTTVAFYELYQQNQPMCRLYKHDEKDSIIPLYISES